MKGVDLTTTRHGIKRLPVITKEDELVGLVSRADIVRAVARDDSYGGPRHNWRGEKEIV
jgi:CBS domain-containing protein